MDMPSKRRTVAAQAARMGPLPEMPAELIEQPTHGCSSEVFNDQRIGVFARCCHGRSLQGDWRDFV
jgi:hypothetical protein